MRWMIVLFVVCGWMVLENLFPLIDGREDKEELSTNDDGQQEEEEVECKMEEDERFCKVDNWELEMTEESRIDDDHDNDNDNYDNDNDDDVPKYFFVLNDPDNFLEFVKTYSFTLIYFYHPKCAYCQTNGMVERLKVLSKQLEHDIWNKKYDVKEDVQFPRIAVCNIQAFDGPWNQPTTTTTTTTTTRSKEGRRFLEETLPTLKHVPDFKFIIQHTTIWEYVNNHPNLELLDDFVSQLQQYIWHYWTREMYSHNKVFHLSSNHQQQQHSQIISIQDEPKLIVQPILSSNPELTPVSLPTMTIFQLQLSETAESHYLPIYETYADIFIHRINVGFTVSPLIDNQQQHQQHANLLVWEKPTQTSAWEQIATYSLPQEATNNVTFTMDQLSKWIVTHTTPTTLWWNTTQDISRSSWVLSLYYPYILMVFLPHDASSSLNPFLESIQSTIRHFRQQQPQQQFMTVLIPETNLRLIQKFGLQDEPLPTILVMPREGMDKNIPSNIRIYHLSSTQILSQITLDDNDNPTNHILHHFLNSILLADSPNTTEEEYDQIYKQFGYQPSTISYYYSNANDNQDQKEKDSLSSSSSSSSNKKPYCTPTLNICHVTSQNYVQHVLLDTWNVHTLVYFFSPSCGHCKRFHVTIWEVLAKFIQKYNLSDTIQLIQMDVTENLVILEKDWFMDTNRKDTDDGSFLENVPALLYYPAAIRNDDNNNDMAKPHPKKRISYAARVESDDQLGECNLGGANDPYGILEWMISFGHFNEDELLQHLESII